MFVNGGSHFFKALFWIKKYPYRKFWKKIFMVWVSDYSYSYDTNNVNKFLWQKVISCLLLPDLFNPDILT
jgi:hypothetical protein